MTVLPPASETQWQMERLALAMRELGLAYLGVFDDVQRATSGMRTLARAMTPWYRNAFLLLAVYVALVLVIAAVVLRMVIWG